MKFSKTAIAVATLLISTASHAAKYKVVELSVAPDYRQSFGIANNDVGDVLSISRDSVNFPFYFDVLSSSIHSTLRANCGVSQEELDAEALDASSAACLKSELARTSPASTIYAYNSAFQKVGDIKTSYFGNNYDNGVLNLVDQIDERLGTYTKSNTEQLSNINNSGVAVGTVSAPYVYSTVDIETTEGEFTPTILFSREYGKRAVLLANGEVSTIEPTNTTYGGASSAFDISETGYVSGIQSIGVTDTFTTQIETGCEDSNLPLEICQWSYTVQGNVFKLRPVVWKLDSNNSVIETTTYDLAFEPTEVQTGNYTAYAAAVNDAGIAVGYGDAPLFNSSSATAVAKYPLVFANGETKHILSESDGYDAGYAVDINNQNLVVGKVQKFFDGQFNDTFFVYDLNSDTLEFPVVFYKGSQAIGNSINNNGIVVGEGEYEVTTANQRRKHAFIYNAISKEFNDINDLTECSSTYEIIEARDINNNNEIVATALKTVEQRDALGEVVKDDSGAVVTVEVPVAVLLEPIDGGSVDVCAEDVSAPYERKGFANSIWLISLLGVFVVIRRRFL